MKNRNPLKLLPHIVCLICALGCIAGCTRQQEPPPAPQPETQTPTSKEDAPAPPEESSQPEEPELPVLLPGQSYVFVESNTDGTDDGVERLLRKMEQTGQSFYQTERSPDGIIGANDVVILKINCQWNSRGGTNVDLLNRVVEAISKHPDGFSGEIVIADNGQAQYGSDGTGGSLDWAETNSANRTLSPMDVAERWKSQINISGYLWDDITMTRVDEFSEGDNASGFIQESKVQDTGLEITYPKFTTEYGTMVSFRHGIWDSEAESYDVDRLRVINMPVLKVHALCQVTGCVKAYMGVVANRLTNHRAHNSVLNGGMGTQMALTRVPDLNILDMIWVGVENGPMITDDTAVQKNMIAASTDPVALDYWAAKNVLMPELKRLPGGRDKIVDPGGTDPGVFGYWLERSRKELEAAGIPATTDEAKITIIS